MEMEERHLAEADRHIAQSEIRIGQQELRLAELKSGGHDSAQAEWLLQNLKETLAQFYAHRDLIVAELERGGIAAPKRPPSAL